MAFLRSIFRWNVSKKIRLNSDNLNNIFSTRNPPPSISSTCEILRYNSTKSDDKPRRDPLDTSFNDPEAAFKSKTTWEIIRAYLVYTLCSSNYLVEHNMELMKVCKAMLGEKLFTQLMKSSFYGHFVAGEDQYRIVPTLQRLRSFGVKPILDYSVEEDLSQEEAEKREVESSVSEIKTNEAASEETYCINKKFLKVLKFMNTNI